MDVVDDFIRRVRGIIGLDYEGAPVVDRMALYRAEVKAAASDGSTVDVQPDSSRLDAMKNVPVRVGVPGMVAVVKPKSIVLIGWELGNPKKPYAVPAWEPGAELTRLKFNVNGMSIEFHSDTVTVDATGKTLELKGDTVKITGTATIDGSLDFP